MGDRHGDAMESAEPQMPQVPQATVSRLSQCVIVLRMDADGAPEVVVASRGARTIGLVAGGELSVDLRTALVSDAIERAVSEKRSAHYSLSLPTSAARPARHLEVTVSALDDGLVLLEAEDRSTVQRVDETRRDFIANVSHELKTPIGGVLLLAEAMEEASDDPDAVRHFGQRLREEALRLTDMVNQLIELSRLTSEAPLRNAETVDMEEIVDDALARCSLPASRKSITLLTTGAAGGLVYGDELQLVDAVANLVLNAIAYSERKSRVTITLRRVAEGGHDFIEVAVADRGMGIRAEDLDRIFERFYRVDYGRSRAHGGTGLGLSLVRHIAESHGGSVRVSSVFGEGSTFTLRLPQYLATDAVREATTGRHGAATTQGER